MDRDLLSRLNEIRRRREPALLMRQADGGASVLWQPDDEALPAYFRAAVEAAFRSGKSGLVRPDAEGPEYFLHVFLPPPRLLILGAVHIAQSLAPMAAMAGFDVRIVDPRTGFASPQRFPGVRLLSDWPQDHVLAEPLDRFTAVATLTHEPRLDDPALVAALAADCFYVGALGSRKTHAKRVERLVAAGVAADRVATIRAPIGLAIAAQSPAEIAVSILAEIVETLRKGPAAAGVPARGPA